VWRWVRSGVSELVQTRNGPSDECGLSFHRVREIRDIHMPQRSSTSLLCRFRRHYFPLSGIAFLDTVMMLALLSTIIVCYLWTHHPNLFSTTIKYSSDSLLNSSSTIRLLTQPSTLYINDERNEWKTHPSCSSGAQSSRETVQSRNQGISGNG